MNKMFTFMRESSTARILIPIGILVTIFGIITFIITLNNQNYIKTEATVTKVTLVEEAYTDTDGNHVDATYDVRLKYTVDGKEYETTLNNVGKYKKNEKVKIYYNPEDPNKITQTKSIFIPIVFIVAGIASIVGGIISAINAVKKSKKMKEQERNWKDAK